MLEIHRSYLHVVTPLLDKDLIKGISHITGSGIEGNTRRILPSGTSLNIDWNSWQPLPIFKLIKKIGNIDDEEMRHVFNMGIGMILIASKNKAGEVCSLLQNEKPVIMGDIK